MIYSTCSTSKREFFGIGRSRHTQIVELAPCRPNFTYPSSIIMLVMPYGVESKGLLPVLETTLKAGRRSCSLRFTPASRDHAKRFRGIFCSGHRHSLHVSQSAADWDIRFRGFSNDVCRERFRDYSFRETVTRKCKDTENTWARQF